MVPSESSPNLAPKEPPTRWKLISGARKGAAQLAAALWSRKLCFWINKLSLSLKCKQVGGDRLYFLARASVISFPFLSKGTKPWERVYSSKPDCLAWPRKLLRQNVLSSNTPRRTAARSLKKPGACWGWQILLEKQWKLRYWNLPEFESLWAMLIASTTPALLKIISYAPPLPD